MTTKIIWTRYTVNTTPTFRTQRFDIIQGEIYKSGNTWSAWLMNWLDSRKGEYCLGFKSKETAIQWVNNKLREKDVK